MTDVYHSDGVKYTLELSEAEIMRIKSLMGVGIDRLVLMDESNEDATKEAVQLQNEFLKQYREKKSEKEFEWVRDE